MEMIQNVIALKWYLDNTFIINNKVLSHMTWTWLRVWYINFSEFLYINFTEISIANRASIRCQARETTTSDAPDEPPNVCLFAWGIRRHLSWSESANSLISYCFWGRLRTCPQMFNWKQVWGLPWTWESRDSAKLQIILDNTRTMDSCAEDF